MRIISHRGNLKGPSSTENTFEAIEETLDAGFDVEIDVWYVANKFWLGHDEPERSFHIDMLDSWSKKGDVYVHCKNIWSAQFFLEDYGFKFRPVFPFMHDNDQAVFLHNEKLWVHPNAVHSVDPSLSKKCIAVLPSLKSAEYDINLDLNFESWYGICTDYPLELRKSLERHS